jgi:hypothetical protein
MTATTLIHFAEREHINNLLAPRVSRRLALTIASIAALLLGATAPAATAKRRHHPRRPVTFAFYRVAITLWGSGFYARSDPSGKLPFADQFVSLVAHGTAHLKITSSHGKLHFKPSGIPSTGSIIAFNRSGWGYPEQGLGYLDPQACQQQFVAHLNGSLATQLTLDPTTGNVTLTPVHKTNAAKEQVAAVSCSNGQTYPAHTYLEDSSYVFLGLLGGDSSELASFGCITLGRLPTSLPLSPIFPMSGTSEYCTDKYTRPRKPTDQLPTDWHDATTTTYLFTPCPGLTRARC